MGKLTKREVKKVLNNKIFKKNICKKMYWIKPLYNSNYKKGNIESHIRYFRILNDILKKHIPKLKKKIIKIDGKQIMLLIIEHINGNSVNFKKLKRFIENPINKRFKIGIRKLLEKGYVLDFYGDKENFIISKNKIYYVDSRMPLFSKKSNEGGRFKISEEKTKQLLEWEKKK